MNLLFIKLLLTPLMTLAASLVGRRFGDRMGGWLVGLPLTSGPVSVFVSIEFGLDFATEASRGSLASVSAQACFCLGYWLSARAGILPALLAASVAFVVVAVAISTAALTTLPLFVLAVATILVALRLVPNVVPPRLKRAAQWWEIPMRMAVVTAVVVSVTTFAGFLGPRASGVAASYPLIGAAFAVFAHRAQGAAAGVAVLRGMTSALFAFAAFFFAVGMGLVNFGIAVTFVTATAAALLTQAATLVLMRAPPKGEV